MNALFRATLAGLFLSIPGTGGSVEIPKTSLVEGVWAVPAVFIVYKTNKKPRGLLI